MNPFGDWLSACHNVPRQLHLPNLGSHRAGIKARTMLRRLPPLNALKAFEAAARSESFTRAAEELSVTQAAISQQVKVLEEALGLTLFHRERQRLAITEAGREYLE